MQQDVGIWVTGRSSISKGVEVLSRVSDEMNDVFLHLENPELCDECRQDK
jgi:hypothetical protein